MSHRTGETFHERTKGKDVRTSNIIAANVSLIHFNSIDRSIDWNFQTCHCAFLKLSST